MHGTDAEARSDHVLRYAVYTIYFPGALTRSAQHGFPRDDSHRTASEQIVLFLIAQRNYLLDHPSDHGLA
jgi:hypothetical protein